jgi:septum formation inhibitor MinC
LDADGPALAGYGGEVLAGGSKVMCRQYAPSRIRIAGELDYQAEEPLALADVVRLEGDLMVNVAALQFIDAPVRAHDR